MKSGKFAFKKNSTFSLSLVEVDEVGEGGQDLTPGLRSWNMKSIKDDRY